MGNLVRQGMTYQNEANGVKLESTTQMLMIRNNRDVKICVRMKFYLPDHKQVDAWPGIPKGPAEFSVCEETGKKDLVVDLEPQSTARFNHCAEFHQKSMYIIGNLYFSDATLFAKFKMWTDGVLPVINVQWLHVDSPKLGPSFEEPAQLRNFPSDSGDIPVIARTLNPDKGNPQNVEAKVMSAAPPHGAVDPAQTQPAPDQKPLPAVPTQAKKNELDQPNILKAWVERSEDINYNGFSKIVQYRLMPWSRGESMCGISFNYYDKQACEAVTMVCTMTTTDVNNLDVDCGVEEPTAHLRLFCKKLKDECVDLGRLHKGQKVNWVMGFAITADHTLKRNSCANYLGTGSRTLTEAHYSELFQHLQKHQGYEALTKEEVAQTAKA